MSDLERMLSFCSSTAKLGLSYFTFFPRCFFMVWDIVAKCNTNHTPLPEHKNTANWKCEKLMHKILQFIIHFFPFLLCIVSLISPRLLSWLPVICLREAISFTLSWTLLDIKPFWVSPYFWLCLFDGFIQSVQLWFNIVYPLSFNLKVFQEIFWFWFKA